MRMNELTERRDRPIEQFDPSRHRLKVAALDYTIEEAKRIREWPALEAAVDDKIAEQIKFVAWWDVKIRSQGEARKEIRDPGFLSVPEAKKLTGMAPQRVSDLREELKEPQAYRDALLGPEFYAAYIGDEEKAKRIREAIGSGQVEWYTPTKYIDLAREVLGAIDLDPASSDIAQRDSASHHLFYERGRRSYQRLAWPSVAQPALC
jgi:hypothetical protein